MDLKKIANSKWEEGHKNTNAFTLIELLAIIVILAIISVITIPILLNVIENSRKGAVKDSVYGYKDAINKYYLGRLSGQSNYNMPDEECIINSNGYLVCPSETLEIQVSGSIPSGGAIKLEKNAIKQACIKFDDYAVTITNGTVGDAQKASCNGTTIGSSSNNDTPTMVTAAQTILNETGNVKGYLTEEQLAAETNKAAITKPVKIEHPEITENTATGETIPALTSYRYMGADPNNYILFNCEDYNETLQTKSNCEMWRIISIENGQLKITPDIAITDLTWDFSINDSCVNNWATSSLNNFLNVSYLDSSYSSFQTTTTVTGGKEHNVLNSETAEMIANSTWYLGGGSSSKITAAQAYAMERGNAKYTGDGVTRETFVNSKVAIISPSDYGFASSACYGGSKTLYDYNDSTCTSSNWMYYYQDGLYTWNTWMLLPDSNHSYGAWTLGNSGDVYHSSSVNFNYGVRPSIYLKSDIGISGFGTSSDPYKIIK